MTTSPDSASSATSSTSAKPTACRCCAIWLPSGASLGFIILRFWLAIRALVTGIEKFTGSKMVQSPLLDEFGNPDISGAMVEVQTKVYGFSHYHGMPTSSLEDTLRAEPLMPGWMLTTYCYALGPLLILTGLTLLLGIAPRISLFVQGLIYVSLTVGMILLGGQNEIIGTAMLGVHTIMVALALKWVEHNRWSVCSCGAKC
jgi:thiosulfate dehydrogenase [quinone] large subunit